MPSTTNFGWTTPADTDLVKDGAAAIRTLGNGIDTSFLDLKGGTSGQVLAKNSNTDLDFVWVAQDDSNAIQNAIVDAKGDLISATAADTPARLAVGANNTVLTADSSTATGLKWAAPAAGGKVLQVVNATTSTSATNTTTTYADTNLTATITPTLNTSKVLIILSQDMGKATGTNGMNVKLLRGATNLLAPQAVELGIYTNDGANLELYSHSYGITYLDSPATTSATTYKTQFAIRAGGTGTVLAQGQGSFSTITLMEIGA
jgi:hypothetical protein